MKEMKEIKENEKKKVVKVMTYKGSIYTITINEMTDTFIQGVDKNGYPIKLLLSEIETFKPVIN